MHLKKGSVAIFPKESTTMNATEELIATETGKLSLGEKKASIAESHTSTSSSSSSTTSKIHHCPCSFQNNNVCCNHFVAGCHLPLQPCLVPHWGAFYMLPPCYNQCFPMQKCCLNRIRSCQACPVVKSPTKKCKTTNVESVNKVEEKICNCCKDGKCECCKSGQECGKDDDKASVKSDKSEKSDKSKKSSGSEDDEEKDDEIGGGYSHSVARLVDRFSKEV